MDTDPHTYAHTHSHPIRFNVCPISKKFQVTNIDIDYKLKKVYAFNWISSVDRFAKSLHRWDASIWTPKYVHEQMSMVYSVMVYLKQHLKVLCFYCCCCLGDDRIQPIALRKRTALTVWQRPHRFGTQWRNHLKHAIYACTWKDYISQTFCVQIHRIRREIT